MAKKNTSTYTSIQDNFNIDWRIIPALRLQGRISYTRQFDKRDLFKSPESLDYSTETDPKKKGTYFRSNSQSDKFDGNLTLQYNKVGSTFVERGRGKQSNRVDRGRRFLHWSRFC